MKSQMGLSVLLISHSAHVQANLADRVLIMKKGALSKRAASARLTVSALESDWMRAQRML